MSERLYIQPDKPLPHEQKPVEEGTECPECGSDEANLWRNSSGLLQCNNCGYAEEDDNLDEDDDDEEDEDEDDDELDDDEDD